MQLEQLAAAVVAEFNQHHRNKIGIREYLSVAVSPFENTVCIVGLDAKGTVVTHTLGLPCCDECGRPQEGDLLPPDMYDVLRRLTEEAMGDDPDPAERIFPALDRFLDHLQLTRSAGEDVLDHVYYVTTTDEGEWDTGFIFVPFHIAVDRHAHTLHGYLFNRDMDCTLWSVDAEDPISEPVAPIPDGLRDRIKELVSTEPYSIIK